MNPKKKDTQSDWSMGDSTIVRKDCHTHLGIPKSATHLDITDSIISKGLNTFYALHGAGAHTLGLIPTLSAHLWEIFCIPRMLYGTAILHFTKYMETKLNRAQLHLFKGILGVPSTAADECVYLLTGLLPISARIELEKLLLLGQMLNLDHSRFEYGTFLNALHANVPVIKTLRDTLVKYELPDLEGLMTKPFRYRVWKLTAKRAIKTLVETTTLREAASKSSLALLMNSAPFDPNVLYPKDPPSIIIRQALTVRAQLLTTTYLTQSRLCKIGKGTDPKCRLCTLEDDTVEHLVAICPSTDHLRSTFHDKLKAILQDFPSAVSLFDPCIPRQFTESILLPYNPTLPHSVNAEILKTTLHYLFKVHTYLVNHNPAMSQL